jgi:hypothetical protein
VVVPALFARWGIANTHHEETEGQG